MKILKITEASEYLGMSINTVKALADKSMINSFKTSGGHRRFRQEDLDAYMGVGSEKPIETMPIEEYDGSLPTKKAFQKLIDSVEFNLSKGG